MNPDGMNPASRAPVTPQGVNRRNQEFWLMQSQLRDRRMSDELLRSFAEMDMRSESVRGVPIKSEKTLEQALADAEMAKNTFQRAFSRKGGSAPRCDALQTLIEEIAAENQKIKPGQLLIALSGPRGAGVIASVDKESDVKADEPRMIHFVEENGMPKRARLSGLKDRLFRAKKKRASR